MELQSVCHGISAPRVTGLPLFCRKAARLEFRRFWVGEAEHGYNQTIQLFHTARKLLETVTLALDPQTTATSWSSSFMMGELLLCVEMIYREEMWSFMLRQDQGVTVRWTGWSLSVGNQGWCPINGLTHPLVKEGKLESAPFEKNKGSFLWVLAPVALKSSLIIPQFFLGNAIEAFLKNEIFVEILTSLAFDATFYVGLVTFLFVTDCVQRPYLQFSPKRLSLITGLRGYLSSAFLGFKVVIPLFTIYISWPEVGLPLVVAMAPFLAGYLAQLVFEKSLDKSWSSCWPLVPILFEVYKLYQLTKAAHYIERLMYTMKDLPTTPELLLPEAISFQTCIRELVIFGPPDFTPLFVRAGVGPRLLRLNRATFLGMHFGPL